MAKPRDRWAYIQRKQMMEAYAEYLVLIHLIDNPILKEYAKDVLSLAENDPLTLRFMAKVLRAYGSPRHATLAERYVKKAAQLEILQ